MNRDLADKVLATARAMNGELDFEGALAKAVWGLARVEDKLGRAERAREGYRAFLELWKDADVGRPEVEEARARLAALSGPAGSGR